MNSLIIYFKRIYFNFYLINFFSFIKRLIDNPLIYSNIKLIPLLLIPGKKISYKNIYICFYFTVICIISTNYTYIYYLVPFIILFIFYKNFCGLNLYVLVLKTKWFLVLSILYALVQLYFNYLPFERRWVYSSLSVVNEHNLFIENRNIRVFSFFASTPEFSLFCSIYLICFIRLKDKAWSFISLLGFLLSGTRGLILGFLLSYLIVYVIKCRGMKKVLVASTFLTSAVYLLMHVYNTIIINFFDKFEKSRLLLARTFYGRLEILQNQMTLDLKNYIIPLKVDIITLGDLTFDNLHASLLFRAGIIGYVLFWFLFRINKNDSLSLFFYSLLIVYGFFADVIFSFYLLFLFILAIQSPKYIPNLINTPNLITQNTKDNNIK